MHFKSTKLNTQNTGPLLSSLNCEQKENKQIKTLLYLFMQSNNELTYTQNYILVCVYVEVEKTGFMFGGLRRDKNTNIHLLSFCHI